MILTVGLGLIVVWALFVIWSRGGEPRHVGSFLGIYGVLWAGWLVAWWKTPESSRGLVGWILGWALLMRLPLFWAVPLYEDDYFRFLWDGWNFIEHGTPYRGAPEQFVDDPSVPEAMREVLAGVNHPEVPTIYPPVCQGMFAVAAWLAPGSLAGLRLVLLGVEMAALGLLARVAPARALLFVAWCPLLIFETGFQVHPDVLGMFLLVAAFFFRTRDHAWMTGFCSGLALAVKVTALPALLFLLWPVRWRSLLAAAGAWLAVYLPFLLQGSRADWDGLTVFSELWEFNASLFRLAGEWMGDERARLAMAVWGIVGMLGLWISWCRVQAPADKIPGRIAAAYGVLFLVSPVVNPWYLLWLVPFVAMAPRPWSVVWLAVVSLSYVRGQTLPGSGLDDFQIPAWLQALEYGLIGLAWIAGYWAVKRGRKTGLSSPV